MSNAWIPQDVTGMDMAFGGDMSKLLPAYRDIPDEFKRSSNKWCKVVSRWFFQGIKGATFKPKAGIDQKRALAHLTAILRSWEPQREHKEAGVAYLMSLWFDDVILPNR